MYVVKVIKNKMNRHHHHHRHHFLLLSKSSDDRDCTFDNNFPAILPYCSKHNNIFSGSGNSRAIVKPENQCDVIVT